MVGKINLFSVEGFEWDKGNLEHLKKHNLQYKECEEAFLNMPIVIVRDKTHSQKEDRFRIYGQTHKKKLILIIITLRRNKIRIISARTQSKKERLEYKLVGGEEIRKK